MTWGVATFAAACLAVVVNAVAAAAMHRADGDDAPPWRNLFGWTTIFATFYAVMFGVRNWGGVDIAAWSDAMIPFSSIAFFTVWIGPAVLATAQHVTIRRHRDRIIESLRDD